MRIAPLIALLLAAACTPVRPAVDPVLRTPGPSLASGETNCQWVPASCTRTGHACAIIYKDAGKACTDSDQCEGRCMARQIPTSGGGVRSEGGACEANSAGCSCAPEMIKGVPADAFTCTSG